MKIISQKITFNISRYSKNGYVLPLVIMGGLLLGAGILSVTTRTHLDNNSSIRQSQGRNSREIAEYGLSKVLEEINRTRSHLLAINSSEWSASSAGCDSSGTIDTTGTVRDNGVWTLESYTFKGQNSLGGLGTFRMRGEIKRNDETISASIVEQTVNVTTKPCGGNTGFAGLIVRCTGGSSDLGNNDVLGAGVLGIQCDEGEIGSGPNAETPSGIATTQTMPYPDILSIKEATEESGFSDNTDTELGSLNAFYYDRQDCNGNSAYTPTPQHWIASLLLPGNPAHAQGNGKGGGSGNSNGGGNGNGGGNNPSDCSVVGNDGHIRITSYANSIDEDPAQLLNGSCKHTSNRTHLVCNIEKILVGNDKLIFDTQSGIPIITYFTGTGDVFDSTGLGGIEHVEATGAGPCPTLLLFGNPLDLSDSVTDQEFTFSGGSTSESAFIHFPDGNMGINGGSSNNCNPTSFSGCEGDLNGAVLTKTWNGSSSNVAQITIPEGFLGCLSDINPRFGSAYIPDHSARGVSSWSSSTEDDNADSYR